MKNINVERPGLVVWGRLFPLLIISYPLCWAVVACMFVVQGKPYGLPALLVIKFCFPWGFLLLEYTSWAGEYLIEAFTAGAVVYSILVSLRLPRMGVVYLFVLLLHAIMVVFTILQSSKLWKDAIF